MISKTHAFIVVLCCAALSFSVAWYQSGQIGYARGNSEASQRADAVKVFNTTAAAIGKIFCSIEQKK